MNVTPLYNYNSPALAYDHMRKLQGMVRPGRYAGLDELVSGAGLAPPDTIAAAVSNLATSYTDIAQNGNLTTLSGKVVTTQGAVLIISEPETEAIYPEYGGVEPRVDLVVINHQWQQVAGGQAATISLIKGIPSSNPVAPPVSNQYQTPIGEIFVPISATLLSEITYTPYGVPLPGTGTGSYSDLVYQFLYNQEQLNRSSPNGLGPFHAGAIPNHTARYTPHANLAGGVSSGDMFISKNPWGQVLISGLLAPVTNIAAGQTVLTLAVNFRPHHMPVIVTLMKDNWVDIVHGRIQTNGAMILDGNLSSGGWYLQPVMFQSDNENSVDWTRSLVNTNNPGIYDNPPITL